MANRNRGYGTGGNVGRGFNWLGLWTGLIAFIVVAAVIFGLFMWRTDGGTDWTFGFGAKDDQTQGEPADKDEDKGDVGNMIITPDEVTMDLMSLEVVPVALYSSDGEEVTDDVAAQAETGYEVTATAYYENGEVALDSDQYFVFSLGWGATNSAPVTDYVGLTSGDRTATITLKKEFDTQIILTCAYAFNPEVKGTVKIDYAKRATGILMDLDGQEQVLSVGSLNTIDVTFRYAGNSGTQNWYMPHYKLVNGATYGTGTVENRITGCNVTIGFSGAAKTALTTALPEYCATSNFKYFRQTGTDSLSVSQNQMTTSLIEDATWVTSDYYMSKFKNALCTVKSQISFSLTVDFEHGASFKKTFMFNVEFDASVSNVTTNNGAMVF